VVCLAVSTRATKLSNTPAFFSNKPLSSSRT
jgi:hypothetical protein